MKIIRYIITITCIAALGAGCKKDLLDRVPQDQISSATFWTSEKDTRLALNGCYALMDGMAYDAWYNDGCADNTFNQYPWESNSTVISAGDINATMDQGYAGSYQMIRRFNYFLDNVGKVSMNDNLKKRFTAEVKFMRAYTYFDMALIFGGVPLLKTSADENTALDVTPETEVIAFVIKELGDAAVDLPASYTGGAGQESGRITRGAALALKARVHLYYKQWTEAATTAQQVMGMGYQLFKVPALTAEDMVDDYTPFMTFATPADKDRFYKGLRSYEKLFWKENEQNKEVILEAQYIENSAYDRSSGINTLMWPGSLSGWSSITPTVDMVNAYWKSDGTPFVPPAAATRATNYNSGNPLPAYFDEFKGRDTRLYATIMFPQNPWNKVKAGFKFTWGRGGNNNTKTGYNFRKLTDPNFTIEWSAPQNFPLIRYAEILLIYAEAKNEQSGPDASVYAALDQIRDRVGMPAVSQTQTQATLRDLVRNERRIELVAEGHRYYDIRRWGIAGSVMKNEYDIMNTLVQTRKWDNKFMKMPYPQTAVDRNPKLKAAQSAKGY